MRFLIGLCTLLLLSLTPVWAHERCECGPSCHCARDSEQGKLEGRLAPAGPSIFMEGSHELRNGAGKVIARLSGLDSNVDLASYEGQWVQLFGTWRPSVEAGGEIFVVTSVHSAQAP